MPALRTLAVAFVGLPPLLAQTDWTQLSPPTAPPAFTAHAMAHTLVGDKTVLFGGVANGIRSDQTWLWDGTTWAQATPATVPPARVAHTLTYDVVRGRLVMFGGIPAGGGLLGDTWEWDGVDWILMTPVNSPSPRRSHTMVYHPVRQRTILWGGFATADLNDMWEWDGIDWTPITTTTQPPARRASDIAYDPINNSLVLFSGYLQGNDTWRYDGVDWVQLTPATSPSARYDHSMVTDYARQRIVMFGGPGPADQWEWDGSTWLNRTPATLPAARSDTYLAFDPVRDVVWMFGSSPTPETWSYGPTTPASFITSGAGCSGTLTTPPQLLGTDRPWLGEVFTVEIWPVPTNTIGLMLYGLSNTTSSLGALPLSLTPLGMPGCNLLVDPVLIDAFLATGSSAFWNLAIPNASALLGAQIYNQGGALDPGANSLGLIVANAGAMVLGGK